MFTDTHTHLHFDQYEADLPQVMERARHAGIDRILTLGTDLESSRQTVEIAKRYEDVFAAVGIHPTDVRKSAPEDIAAIEELAAAEKKVVAIGEIGLDLYWKEVPLEDQIPVFKSMLGIAERLGLPVVIHNRDAQQEMQQLFRELEVESLRGVMHSFAGTVEDAQFYLQQGMYISFTGVITFKNFKEMETVETVPLDRLLLETDSPFLAPVPNRGKRNEPSFVEFTARKLAEIHNVDVNEIFLRTTENANALFRWKTG